MESPNEPVPFVRNQKILTNAGPRDSKQSGSKVSLLETKKNVPEKHISEPSAIITSPKSNLHFGREESGSNEPSAQESRLKKHRILCKSCRLHRSAMTAFIGDRRPSFIDSHCHLDFMMNRQTDSGATYGDFMLRRKDTYPETYEGCVAVFCNPFSFKKEYVWQGFLEDKAGGVWGAFGCHPNNAHFYDESVEAALLAALRHPKVRALGEIGLDYSNRRNGCPRDVQRCVLRRQLRIAVSQGLPLVIHCRDADQDCMQILKELVPPDHRVHLHCFTGGGALARSWLALFPNLFLGLTNWLARAPETRLAVHADIPLHRILLETDAPYFLPAEMSGQCSHPGMAIYVAKEIAALKQVPLKEILHWTRFNTHRMYDI